MQLLAVLSPTSYEYGGIIGGVTPGLVCPLVNSVTYVLFCLKLLLLSTDILP